MKTSSLLLKKYRIFIFSIPLILVMFVTILFNNSRNLTEREQYEQFLNEEYKKIPTFSKKELEDIPKPDRPDLAAIQNYFMTLDPELKRVPVERLRVAHEEMLAITTRNNKKTRGGLLWDEQISDMGGRTRAIMFDPNDPNHKKVWAGAVTGGLWYNDDITSGTTSWIPVDDFWANLSISSITYDPNNPQTFYVGTGESQTAVTIYRESSGRGTGILKSTDGGNAWNHLSSTVDFAYITDIIIRNESGSSVLYAGVISGFYKGSSHQSQPTDGLYRSEDGGATWSQVLPNINGLNVPYPPGDVVVGADGRIYVGTTNNINGDGGSVILYSDSGTIGTWSIYDHYVDIIESHPSYGYTGRVIMATAPSDPNIVYGILTAGYLNSDNNFIYYRAPYIIRSENKGVTWTQKSIPTGGGYYWASIPWHALVAAVDPSNPDRIFVGGLNLFRSSDGGSSWEQLSDWFNYYHDPEYLPYAHADQHSILFRPGSSNEMLFSNDAGLFYTPNGMDSELSILRRNKAYNTLQFYTCAIHPNSGTTYYLGGLQDNGTHRYTGTPMQVEEKLTGGDGAYCFIDEDEPDVQITSVYYNRYYISDDAFYHYDAFHDFESGTFINPADYDDKLNTLYANATTFTGQFSDRLLRITGIPSFPNGYYLPLNTGSSVPFSHIKVSPHSGTGITTLFVGTQSGRLFRVNNAQAVPQVIEIGSSAFPAANISCVAVGGSNDTLIVTFSNYGVSSVWKTFDGGDNWSAIEGNLPDMPIRWAIFHPQNSWQALLATELGIWSTNNLIRDSVEWTPVNDGLANVRVDMLDIRKSDNTVLAGTHGRGFFTTNYELDKIEVPVVEFSANNTSILIGDTVKFSDLSAGTVLSWTWNFEGGIPTTSTDENPSVIYNTQGEYDVSLTVNYSSGSYSKMKSDYVIVTKPVGIDFLSKSDELSVYPNPTTGIIYLIQGTHSTKDLKISIFNTTGDCVYRIDGEAAKRLTQINLTHFEKGIYYLQMSSDDRYFVRRIILL